MIAWKMWPLECLRFPLIWPGDLLFYPKWPSFKLNLEIIKTNILSKIHDDCFKNVTARVLTRFSADLARWPSFWPHVTQFQTGSRNHHKRHNLCFISILWKRLSARWKKYLSLGNSNSSVGDSNSYVGDNKSYVGLTNAYVGLTISYVGVRTYYLLRVSNSYVGLIISYVGVTISYVWLIVSYVGLTNAYVGLIICYVG